MDNPFDKVQSSNPFDTATTPSSNPFDSANETPNQPNISPVVSSSAPATNPFDAAKLTPDQEQVKSVIAQMPQYAMSPAGAAGPSIPVQTAGPLPKDPVEEQLNAIDAEYERSAKGPFEFLKKVSDKRRLAQETIGKPPTPLEVAAKPFGAALGFAQRNFGKPVAVNVLKSALQQDIGEPSAVDTKAQRETKEFTARTTGTPMSTDIKPPKSVIPSAAEIVWRRLLSATGGEEMKLSPEQEAIGMAENMDYGHVSVPFAGDFEIAKGVLKGVEMAGELPYYIVGETGIGARVTASKMEKLAAATELQTPKMLVKGVNAAKRAGAGAEFATQNAIIASKNNEDVHAAAVEGYVFGQVMELLHSTFTGSSATKKEILQSVNAGRAKWGDDQLGMVLPPITWKEYVKGFGEKVGRAETTASMKLRAADIRAKQAEKDFALGDSVYMGEKRSAETTVLPKQLGPKAREGSDISPYSFKTIEYGRSGELREVRYLDNAKTGKRKKVFDERVTAKYSDPQSGPMVSTDGDAFTEYLNIKHPSRQTDRQGWGKAQYKAPEEANVFIDDPGVLKEHIEYLKAQKGQPVDVQKPREGSNVGTAVMRGQESMAKRLDQKAAAKEEATPKLFTTDKNGFIKVTSIIDRTPDTSGLSPRRLEVGDAVQMANGQPGVIAKIEGDKVTIDAFLHPVVEMSQFDVALADEDLINISELFGPKASAEGTAKNLLRMKRLDVKRVMNAAGIDNPAEARAFLDGMEKAGQIEKINDSLWKPNKSYEPQALTTKPKDNDYVVYYSAKGERGKAGVLRGRDPNKPGNYLIEVEQTPDAIGPATPQAHQLASQLNKPGYPVKPQDLAFNSRMLSIPMDKIKSYAPVIGNISRSSLPAQYGVSVPMPVDALVLPKASADTVGTATRMAGQLSKMLSVKDAVSKYLHNFFVHESWLVPLPVRSEAWKLGAQNSVMKGQIERVQSHLASQLGGELSPVDQELSRIITLNATRRGGQPSLRDRELQAFFKRSPQLGQDAQKTITTALDKLKNNEAILSSLGVTKIQELESLRAAGLEEEYSMNVYLKHMMLRKDFAAFVKKQMPQEWDKAVKLISSRRSGEYVWQTEDEMLSVLGLGPDTGVVKGAPTANTNVKAKLKERLALADEITKIIGKLDSASVQIAHSIAATDSMIQRINTYNELAKTPYWSPGPRPDLGGIDGNGVPVPDHELFGAARGGRMHISFKYLLEQKPAHIEARSVLRSLSAAWKFNQTIGGGAPVWVNNVMYNWKGMVASGGLQAPSDFQTFFDSAEMMLKYASNPLQYKGSLYEQAMNNGAIGGGFAGSEINKHRAVNRILDAVRKQKGTAKDQWEMLEGIASSVRGSAEDIGAMYDGIDRLFKLTAYLNNYRRSISQGMSTNDAHALATMRNRQSFPFYEEIAPTIAKLRNGSVSGIAPFLSSTSEEMRVNGTILMRMAKEPDLTARLLAASSIVAGMAGLMREQRRANGISDDMARQALDARTLANQAFNPISVVGPTLDSQGRMQVFNLTQYESLFTLLRMHERDNLPAAVFRNIIASYVGDANLLGQLNNEAFNKMAGVVPLMPDPILKERPGESGPTAFLSWLAQNGGVPQGPLKAYQAYQNSQMQETVNGQLTREQWMPEQTNMKWLGFPFAQPIGQRTLVGRAKELMQNMGETQRYINSIPLNKPEGDQERLINENVNKLQEISDEYDKSQK